MSEKYVVTWDMLQIHARKLASRLLPVEQWKGIIAVSRGGLVPGALLARELGIRHVDTVCISSYDHDNQRELKVLKRAEGDGEGFIVIDDLVDTGGPPWRSAKCIPKRTLSPFSPAGRPLVDDYVVDIPQDTGLNSRGIWAWCLYRLSQVVNSSGQCYLPRPACRAWFFLSFSRLQYPEWHYDGDCTCHRLTSAKRCLNLASNIPKLLRWCVGFLPENPRRCSRR